MLAQTALIWAGSAGAAVALAGAAAIYWAEPDIVGPAPPPMATAAPTQPAPSLPAPAVASAVEAPVAISQAPVSPAVVRPTFDVVSVDPGGQAVVAGRAAPNARVALLDRGRKVGEATADARGEFVILPAPLSPGDHALQLASGGASSQETSNEVPVSVAASPAAGASPPPAASPPAAGASPPPATPSNLVVEAVSTHHVDPGDTLWGISQRIYGDGARYAAIFSANSKQIRDPNLIYPGQTFLVPKGDPKP